jgi:hypothetical protein
MRRQIAAHPPPNGLPTVTRFRAGPRGIGSASLELLYVQSVETISDCICSALAVAILFPLAAILVRTVVVTEMDGKISVNGTALELKRSRP